jgi:hypothetical protein
VTLRFSPVLRGLLVSGITAACACGGAEVVDTTPDAPAATGSVKVERAKSGLAVDVFVEQLAPPEDLKKDAVAYVVWAKPARGGPSQNLGVLALDADEGALRTAIAAEDTSLIITAEPNAQASAPSGQPVLWAYVDVAEPPAAPAKAGSAAPTPPAPPSPAPASAGATCEP